MANIFRTASIWLKGAMACMGLGLLLFVIGFATKSWMVRSYNHNEGRSGLWGGYSCSGSRCHSYNYGELNDYHRAIQAMECLGLIGFVLSTVTLLLYLLLDSCRRRDFLQAATAFCFAGLLFAAIGMAIFGSNSNNDNFNGRGKEVGWSMGIAAAGSAFYGLAGILLIIQLVR